MRFFIDEKIDQRLEEIKTTIHREVIDIPVFKFTESDPPGAQAVGFDDSTWTDFQVGGYWGGYDVVAWFRTVIAIPPAWRDHKVVLHFLTGPRDGYGSTAEALLYVNGQPLQGIDIWHPTAWLPPELRAQDHLSLALRVWSSVLKVPPRRHFKTAQMVRIDEDAEHFYHTAHTLLQAAQQLEANDWRRVRLMETLNRAIDRIDCVQMRSAAYYASLGEARHWLDGQLDDLAALEPDAQKPVLHAVGHSHIDMAWLWRLQHTREKAGRTFSTMLNLMRQYPEFRFLHSSPQLYQYVAEDYPEVFAQVKARIASGEWEINGGMWIEPDANLPNGEALVRQFLLGGRFMQEQFGVKNSVLWLPDVFGYPWALAQIAAGCGITTFITAKLGGNQFERIPYDTFHWRGPDGSTILAYLITTPEPDARYWHTTYNGTLHPYQVKQAWEVYQQKEISHDIFTPFGWGDGGGGPMAEMIESGRTLRNVPGIPRVQFDTVEAYSQRLAEQAKDRDLPVWDGELFLQNHRGVFSSQAYIKQANRQAEILYHEAEWLCALADVLIGTRHYPAEALRKGWELILLNQFHDILCGTSIPEVHDESRADYARIRQIGEQARAGAEREITSHLAAKCPSVAIFHAQGWQADDLVIMPWDPTLEGRTIEHPDHTLAAAQEIMQNGERALLLDVRGLPSLGYRVYPLVARIQSETSALSITPEKLENRFWRITLNSQGQITSLYDKQNHCEVLAGPGNVLQAFEDCPIDQGDAWNVELYTLDKCRLVEELIEAVVEETGPVRGVLRLTWRFYDSTITQRLTLYSHHPRIDFRTDIDWHEKQIMLKAAFPTTVRARLATYDSQFGPVERSTHRNTGWDLGHFEAVVHKWADLSEGNYGVALLNDCKYGMDIHDHVMRLTLLRSPKFPDPSADLGRHTFTYSLLPHAGDWRTAQVHRAGYALNRPARAVLIADPQPAGTLSAHHSFAEVDADHVVIETVKRAEDDPQAWIVRVYETMNYRNPAVHVIFGHPIRHAVECNLVEEDDHPVEFLGDVLTFATRPRAIKTFKVWFE